MFLGWMVCTFVLPIGAVCLFWHSIVEVMTANNSKSVVWWHSVWVVCMDVNVESVAMTMRVTLLHYSVILTVILVYVCVCVCSIGGRHTWAAYWWVPSMHPSNYLLSFFLLHLSFSQSSLLPLLYPCLSLCRVNSRCFWLVTVFILEDLGALSIGYIKVFLSISIDRNTFMYVPSYKDSSWHSTLYILCTSSVHWKWYGPVPRV